MKINPDAGNLGGKVGFIFLATGLIAAVGGFFLYPETKVSLGSTLQRIYANGLFREYHLRNLTNCLLSR
jgi:hypothetical protein